MNDAYARSAHAGAPLEDVLEIWTPTEIQHYCDLVATGFRSLALDIQKNTGALTPAELQAWNDIYKKFINFYNGIGFFSRLTLSTVRTAESFAKQLGFWRKAYAGKGATPTGPEVQVPISLIDEVMGRTELGTGTEDKKFGTGAIIAVAGAVGLVAIATVYVVSKFAK